MPTTLYESNAISYIKGVNDLVELLTLNQFKTVKESGIGYVAITDKNLPKNCVHFVTCYEVNESYFNQKVIISCRKNGSYYFIDDFNDALSRFAKMSKCKTCFG
jgi:hypothetical protein